MKTSLIKPALSKVLSVVLPTQEQTLLLRACLWSGEPGREAWAAWRETVGDPIKLLRDGNERLKGLLPLIFFALRSNSVIVEETLQTCLHTAALREELRINTYRRILGGIISIFIEKQIPAIVVKGASLAETVYESPSLRHSGEIEILLGDSESLHTTVSLSSLGFSQLNEKVNPEWKEIKFKHDSGLPLHLHRDLFPIPYYNVPFDELWARSQIQSLAEIQARILSPADNVLHVCGNAFLNNSSRMSLLWVFDSWFIISKFSNLEWDGLLATARRSHLELPLSITLGYLSEELNASIPPFFLEKLYATASESDREERAYALSVALREMKPNHLKTLMRVLIKSGQWRTLTYVVRRLLLSPANSVRQFWPIHSSKMIGFRYLPEPLRNLVRQVLSLCKNVAGQ
jgi:hypothetical protein